MNLGQPVPAWVLFLHLFEKRTSRLSGMGFYGPDVLPAIQPLSKHWREHKALTLMSGESLHFLSSTTRLLV